MKLSDYISDLLYRYECVIVPEFGGFLTNTKPAIISPYSGTFYPPHKLVTFNNHLKNNDGLLINYIANVDKMPYEYAVNFVKFEVERWKEELKNSDLELDKIGTLSLEGNGSLSFEPQTDVNYLTEAFGLAPFVSTEIRRETYTEQAAQLQKKAPVIITEKRKSPDFLKYAAIFVIAASVIGWGGSALYHARLRSQENSAYKKQKQLEQKIEQATFVVTEALPSINLDVSLERKPYHVIAGAFRYPENAKRKVDELLKKGFNARILGVNPWGLTLVSFDSYDNERDAINNLHNVQSQEDPDAWLLIQEL